MADIEIIPLDHGPPPPPSHIDLVPPPRSVADYHDDPIDSRPAMQQRMSSLSIHEAERRPSMRKRESSISKRRDKYVYYALFKEGDDWSRVRRRKLPVPQDQLEKLAKKGRKKVLEEARNMGSLRSQHFDMLVADVNKGESDDMTWEPVFITKERITRKNRVEVTSMDVVLARTAKVVKPKSKAGELIELNDKKPKDKSGKKDKDKDGSPDEHKRKDSKLEDTDPFRSKPLFHRTGKPMDDYGPLEYANGGLPPEIPHDRPIGARIKEKENDHDDFKDDYKDNRKPGKRSKSRGGGKLKTGVDDVLAGVLSGGPGPLEDSLAHILGDHKDSRSRGGSRAGDYPDAMPGRRSRSRRRPSESRARGSRSRSRATHPEEIRFPPEWDRRGGGGGGGGGGYHSTSSASSVSSDTSKFGFDRFEGSSHTSQDTYHSVTGRGSRYNDDDYQYYKQDPRRGSFHQEKKGYKEHSRGPPLRRASTTYEPHRSAGSRRYSMNRGGYYHDPIPESRQIGYHDDPPQQQPGPLVRRSTYDDGRKPILHYSSDMVDLRARNAEGYMDANLRDDELRRREREVAHRERDLERKEREEREDEMRRREWERQREQEERQRYHDDRRYSRGGGYDDYGDRY